MARQSDVRVTTIKVAHDKISIPIYYNAREERFRATYSGIAFTGPTQAEVEKAVTQAAEESLNVLWIPVVMVGLHAFPPDMNGEYRAEVRFEFTRYYVAKVQGKLLKAEWDNKRVNTEDSDDLRLERSRVMDWESAWPPFLPPLVIDSRRNYVGYGARWIAYLLFSEKLWNNLLALQTSLRNVHANLVDLIGTTDGHTALLAALVLPYTPALPAPQETDSHVD